MKRNLTRKEWANVNQKVDFDELVIDMEVTVDGTDEAGWYTVIDIRNWGSKNDFVELKMVEIAEIKKMTYLKLKEQKQKKVDEFFNEFGGFAFNNDQFIDLLKKLNATEEDLINIGAGGFILKSKKHEYLNLFNNDDINYKIINNDDILLQALNYEFHNYELSYSYDPAYTVKNILKDLDVDDNIVKTPRFKNILKKALKRTLNHASIEKYIYDEVINGGLYN